MLTHFFSSIYSATLCPSLQVLLFETSAFPHRLVSTLKNRFHLSFLFLLSLFALSELFFA